MFTNQLHIKWSERRLDPLSRKHIFLVNLNSPNIFNYKNNIDDNMDSSERDLTGRDLFPGYNSSLHITYLTFPNY